MVDQMDEHALANGVRTPASAWRESPSSRAGLGPAADVRSDRSGTSVVRATVCGCWPAAGDSGASQYSVRMDASESRTTSLRRTGEARSLTSTSTVSDGGPVDKTALPGANHGDYHRLERFLERE